MQLHNLPALDADPDVHDRAVLAQQIRALQERLAFYEGFDTLIQDNITHARELFRLAAQEREAATAKGEQAERDADRREAELHAELTGIAADLRELAQAVEALSRRVATALGEPTHGKAPTLAVVTDYPVAIVVHGVPSARTALSLQRFIGTLPQVSDVAAREFAGGVLRLDARVRDRLKATQFGAWEDPRQMQLLTERPDVVEFTLEKPQAAATGGD